MNVHKRGKAGKQNAGPGLKPKAAALAVAACFSGVVQANPTAPVVVHGSASFASAGNVLTVVNSPNAIINWGSFSIGVNELTRFIQNSSASAVLNRVTGGDPSAILGTLQSNGRVFLLNPNGIVFGAGSVVDVAGLVASTLKLSNEDFLSGRLRFTEGAGAGNILNQGSLSGGSVYLVGKAVTNEGLISSPQGEVLLAAGNSVELVNPGTPNLRVEIVAPENEVRNLGTVTAEAGRIGIYAGLIRQSGQIRADSAVAEGGRILLKSTKSTLIDAGSVTSAKGATKGGEILALSDMETGVTRVAGTLDARATGTGDGGFIETSAAQVKIADTALITAAGSGGGRAGTWLVDPADFYITTAYGGDITGAALAAQLEAYGGTNVTLNSDLGLTGSGGSIYVDDAVSWNSAGHLTLIARNDVNVNSAITNAGSGDVRLYAGWDGISPLTSPLLGGAGGISVNAPLATGGAIALKSADGGILVNAALTAGSGIGLDVISSTGSLTFTASGSASSGGTLDLIGPNMGLASAGFLRANDINIEGYRGETLGNVRLGGTLAGELGLTQADLNKLELNNPATGTLTILGHDINLAGPVSFNPVNVASLFLNAQNSINQSSVAPLAVQKLRADGVNGVFLDGGEVNAVNVLSGQSQNAAFRFSNTGNLEIGTVAGHSGVSSTGSEAQVSITVSGGNLTVASPVWASASSSNASVSLSASGTITVNNTSIYANAGYFGSASVSLTAANGITVSNSSISAQGGSSGGAAVLLTTTAPGGNIAVTGSNISAEGGEGALSSVALMSAGGISVTNSFVYAQGGSASFSFGSGGHAEVTLTANGGDVVVDGSEGVAAFGGYGGGSATIALSATGSVAVQGGAAVRAYGGDGAEGGGGGSASVTINAGSGINVANASLLAYGGYGGSYSGSGGSALVSLNTTGAVVVSNASLAAYGGSGSSGGGAGGINIYAGTGITLSTASTLVAAGGSDCCSGGGSSIVDLGTSTGNITTDAVITATSGGGGAIVRLEAPTGAIIQSGTAGYLQADNNLSPPDAGIELLAAAGIGTLASPVRISLIGDPTVAAGNTGATGDIALSFFNTAATGGTLYVDGDLGGIFNNNPTGTYFIRSEDGGFFMDIPFAPDLNPLLPGQSVAIEAAGNIYLAGPSSGSISTTTGTVKLKSTVAGGAIIIDPSAFVSAHDVDLVADNMEIHGTVTSAGGITTLLPYTLSRNIELGGTTCEPSCGALSLTQGELNNILGGGMAVGNTSGGDLIFVGNVADGPSFLNLSGANILQTAGIISAPLNVNAAGNVTLTQPGNQIPSLSTGSIVGGNVTVLNSGSLGITGTIHATGSVSLTSTAGALTDGNTTGQDIIASSVTLNAATGIGTFANPIETETATAALSSAGGEIGLFNTGNLLLASLVSGGSTAAVEATGTLAMGSAISVAGNVGLLGQGGLTVAYGINAGASGNVSLESGAGADVVFSGSGGVTTSAGAISITSGRDILYGGSAQIASSSGNILLDAANDILFSSQGINSNGGGIQLLAGRDYIHNSAANHNNSSGGITITTGRDLAFNNGYLNTSGGAITLTATGGFAYSAANKINTLGGNILIQSVGSASFTAGGANSSTGDIQVQSGGSFAMIGGAQLTSSSGDIVVEALGAPATGVLLSGATTKIEGATVTIAGSAGASGGSDNVGVRINGGATVRSTSGALAITGNGGSGVSNNNGIRIDGGALVSSATTVLLDGSGASGTSDNSGVKIGNATVRSTGGGQITVNGQGGAGSADNNDGVRLESGAMLTTAGGILIDGFGGSGGNDTVGVKLAGGSTVQSTGGGSVQLYGEGGTGVDNNHGIRLEGSALVASAGAISLTGFAGGSGSGNIGVKFAGGTVQASGAGSISIVGEGGAGLNNNAGIRVEGPGVIQGGTGGISLVGAGAGSGSGNSGLDIAGQVSGGGTLLLAGTAGSGGEGVLVNGGLVFADMVSLVGDNIVIGSAGASSPSEVYAVSGLSVSATGHLKILGGSASGASALLSSSGVITVTTGGDVILAGGAGANAWAKLSGNPDVLMPSIGGAVYLDAGAGAGSYARIEAVSDETIYLDFPMLGSGGFFINGVEGVLHDPVTGTGFFAEGSPAVLGTSLMITYGGIVPPPPPPPSGGTTTTQTLETPVQTLIVASSDSTKPPESEKESNVFQDAKDQKKKKDAPVCR